MPRRPDDGTMPSYEPKVSIFPWNRGVIKPRRRRSVWKAALFEIAILMGVLATATAVTYIVVDPIAYPNRHPRLARLGYELTHYHPRLLKCLTWGGLITFISGHAFLIFMAPGMLARQARKKGRLKPSKLRVSEYLDKPIQSTMPVLLSQSWSRLNDILPGLCVRVPDMRPAFWEASQIDENRHVMQLRLWYVHDPLARKCSRLYPRQLTCTVKLKGRGVRTDMELKYHADSPMDNETLFAIIDRTNALIKDAIATEPETPCSTVGAVKTGQVGLPLLPSLQ